ncbi:MAG: DNA translocase FtsK 4TM domain-containing protein, partial [Aestuariivirga sp.]|nr:DNA translocase FtsK 4TM domain-containing protein [Aestuariivirga sp.]
MAYNRSYDTDDGAIPAALRRFIRHRLFEISGVALLASLVAVGVALATWSVDDPSFNHATDQIAKNYLGYPGAAIADELMQLLGLGVLPLIGIPMAWVVNLLSHERPARPFMAMLAWLAATFLACGAFATLPAPSSWSLAAGLGGNSGDIISSGMLSILALGLKGAFAEVFTGVLCAGSAIWAALRATGLTKSETTGTLGNLARAAGVLLIRLLRFLQASFMHWRAYRAQEKSARALRAASENSSRDIISRLAPAKNLRIEPSLGRNSSAQEPRLAIPEIEEELDEDEGAEDESDDAAETLAVRVTREAKEIKLGKKIKKDSQLNLRFTKSSEFEFPPLTLLAEPKRSSKQSIDLSDEVLEQNARMLEGVLEDFGVRGQIINVKPGPVVTLYELEPAPGIKS